MANVTVYNMEGNEVGTMELNDAVFGAPDQRASAFILLLFASLQINARALRKPRHVLR